MNKAFLIGVTSMVSVLVVSNYLVRFPIGDWWLTWAAFTYPLAFVVTDCVNRAVGVKIAKQVVYTGFLFGLPLSFSFIYILDADSSWFDASRVAIASGLAFVCGQLLDVFVFNHYRRSKAWWLPPLASSTPASIVDTVIFFFVAFVATGVSWWTLAMGDLMVKWLMVVLLLPSYRFFTRRWVLADGAR